MTSHTPEPLLHIPNLLSFARIPLAVILFVLIVQQMWLAGLLVFIVACLTDWLDGWWARRYGPLTLVGRNLDPLADKILVCGAFIYLIPVESAGIDPWMVVVVVVGRELAVTGIRGMVEATGKKFGADWFGKLKMVLQCAVLIGVFLILWLETLAATGLLQFLKPLQLVILWAMLLATIGSGIQYVVKAARLLGGTTR